MEIYSTEEQQAEAIKRFFRDNGVAIIAGVVLGLGGLYGWKAFNQSKIDNAEAASDAYSQFIETAGQDESALIKNADTFLAEQKESSYAALAAFVTAKEAVEAKQLDVALAKLTWVVENSTHAELKAIATTRIARIQLEQKAFDKALATLGATLPASFEASVAELKGDIYLAKGDSVQAQQAYQDAVDANGLANNPDLQIKLDNLAVATDSIN